MDFDVVTDKPSKQESLRNSNAKNFSVNEVEQTVKHSAEQVNTRKKIQSTPTENINNANRTLYSKTMKNGGKSLHLFWEFQQYLGLLKKSCPEIEKLRLDISQEQKLRACTTMQFLQ